MGNFKHDLFKQFVRFANAMSNANRLEIQEFLVQGEHGVDVLAWVTGWKLAGLPVEQ